MGGITTGQPTRRWVGDSGKSVARKMLGAADKVMGPLVMSGTWTLVPGV